MAKNFNRRDFLKLAGLLPLGLAAPRFLQTSPGQKNILIVVFDALSAYDVTVCGYSRKTTPNLARLAERAVVYQKNYAGGNFTTTGTSTLLTGTYAWTHRALEQDSLVAESVAAHNIFNAFDGYYRIAYTHNEWANVFLKQFRKDIEELIPREQLLLSSYGKSIQSVFENDADLASVSWSRAMNLGEAGFSYSLFLSRLYEALQKNTLKKFIAQFPRGVPNAGYDNHYVLEDAIDTLGARITSVPQPFLGYFHFLPPHSPYNAPKEFCGQLYKDGYVPIRKPVSIFSEKKRSDLSERRTEYDEFILYADSEFGRFYNMLEDSGLLENTILVLTSDHGENNERGISGHSTDALYEPLIRVPLMIFEPGRKTRLDITTPTAAIDLLPTLTHLAGLPRPAWSEGVLLPPFDSTPVDSNRSVYAIRATSTPQDKPIDDLFSISLVKGRYKLHYYFGYDRLKSGELIYLFDVEADPEELNDLSVTQKEIADELLSELKAKLTEVNKPYR
jgi:arylsulfatase A-like enzyme